MVLISDFSPLVLYTLGHKNKLSAYLHQVNFYRRPLFEKNLRGHVRTVSENMHVTFEVRSFNRFYPRDAMLARVFAIATCLSVCPSVRPSHAGIVPSRAKAGS